MRRLTNLSDAEIEIRQLQDQVAAIKRSIPFFLFGREINSSNRSAGLLTFGSNALAKDSGLSIDDFYTDGTGNVKVVY